MSDNLFKHTITIHDTGYKITKHREEDIYDIDKIIENAREYYFDFDYKIEDKNIKKHLEILFIEKYFDREIAHETPIMFKIALRSKVKQYATYLNEKIESQKIEFNPMFNIDVHEEYEKINMGGGSTKSKTLSKENTSSNGSSESRFSDTPQNRVTAKNYLTELTENDNENKSDSSLSGDLDETRKHDDNEKFTKHKYGNVGGMSNSQMYLDFLKTIQNIEEEWINLFVDLFYSLYD